MKKDKKRQDLFDVAIEVFARYGYKKATVEDIAKGLGLTKSSLYLYVKDKRDLYEHSVSFALATWQRFAQESAEKESDAVSKLWTYAMSGYNYLRKKRDLHTIIHNDQTIFTVSPSEDRFYKVNKVAMNYLQNILEQGIKEKRFKNVDIRNTTELIFTVYIMFIIKSYVKSEGVKTNKMYKIFIDLMSKGLQY